MYNFYTNKQIKKIVCYDLHIKKISKNSRTCNEYFSRFKTIRNQILKISVYVLSSLFFCSCLHSKRASYEELEHNLISNFEDNKSIFDSIRNIGQHLDSIQYISLNNENVEFWILDTTSTIQTIQSNINKKYSILKILMIDSINEIEFSDLCKYLKIVDCNSLQTVPNSENINKKNIHPIELAYKEWNGILVCYKIFPRDLYEHENKWFKKYLVDKKQGGILNKYTIWYLKID